MLLRRIVMFALAVSLLVAMAVPGIAFATHSGGQGPKKDFANGTGQVVTATLDQQIHVNAQRKPSQQARGWIVEKTTDAGTETRYKARVTCIEADGHDAVIVGEIVKVKAGTVTPGQFVQLFIHDGGKPGANNDQVKREFFAANNEPTCTLPGSGLTPITQGNYTVHAGA